MKKIVIAFLLTIVLLLLLGCKSEDKSLSEAETKPTLRVGITNNLNGKWFPKSLIDSLEDALQLDLEFVYFDGADKLLTGQDSLDLALGIDKSFLRQAIVSKNFCKYKSKNAKQIKKDASLNKSFYFTPVFYDFVCILVDTTQIKNIPSTLGKFQEDVYNQQLIFSNPNFFAYSRMFYVKSLSRFTQNGHRQFWQSMKNKVREIVPNPAYALRMIMAKEAAFWIGGVSYCVHYPRLKPILINSLSIKDVFGVGIYKKSKNKPAAQKFIDLMLSKEVQRVLTQKLAVYPIIKDVKKNKFLPKEGFVDETKDAIKSGYIDWRSKLYLDKHKDLFEKL